jgi:hypothetical protein
MIDFLNEDVRSAFHLLPVDKQREWNEIAERYALRGQQLQILFVENGEDGLEVSIRVNEKFHIRL